jgi:ubiquinone biosynthesis protein
MIFSDQTDLLRAFQNASEEQLIRHLDMLVLSMGEQAFCQMSAGQLVALARPDRAMPDSLVHFGPMVRDGIALFLSQISYPRLRKAIISQARLQADSETGERLLDLALHFPTLHKLGQIIARHPRLDPRLKGWLIHLEKGHYRTDVSELEQHLVGWLAGVDLPHKVSLAADILAEASVAAVLPFTCETKKIEGMSGGVFKVLKPNIEGHLLEELLILEDVAGFFENNRETYGLQDMMVVDLFNEVRDDLVREIDLAAEQKNMAEAAEIYCSVHGVRIPKMFSFCTPTVTSMEFIDGIRITDTEISQDQRKALANLTFEAIICMPLFSMKETALFHGDPHAGNILAVPGKSSDDFGIALIDWTLAGHLTRNQRSHIMEMMVGIRTNDVKRICEAIRLVINGIGPKSNHARIKESVTGYIALKDHQSDPLKMAFDLMAELTMEGVVFPSELILFRKAFFTLEGVLADISPGFSMAETMENYLGRLLLAEIPLRVATGFLPIPDRSLYYPTLLSNQTLGDLTFHEALAAWHKAMMTNSSLVGVQTKMMADFLSCLCGGHLFMKRG